MKGKSNVRRHLWKTAVVLCTAVLVLSSFGGCTQEGEPKTGEDTQKEQQESQVRLSLTPEEYPRVDGSTATIPLSEAFGAAVMGSSVEEARQYILHNTTHLAYENLIDEKADIIFVTSPSADELAYAEEKNVKLEVTPIVSEGFVFLTGKENTVDGLTFDQIKDIYRGKIRNWKDVGGADAAVTAYQRPDNSGSQTGMYELVVPAEEIMKAPTELKPYGMGELVDAVAEYQNGAAALGYSYYYYVTDMWKNDEIKLLSVDGVYPDAKTISSGEYPIQTAYYAVMRSDTPENSSARKLLSWILSEEGQRTAEEAGYVKLGK